MPAAPAPGGARPPPLGPAAPPIIPAAPAIIPAAPAPGSARTAPPPLVAPAPPTTPAAPSTIVGGSAGAAGPSSATVVVAAAFGAVGRGVIRTGVTGAAVSPATRARSRVVPRLPRRRCRSAGAGTGGRRPAGATRSATGGRGRVTVRWTRVRVTATDLSRRVRPVPVALQAPRAPTLPEAFRPCDSTGSTRWASRTCATGRRPCRACTRTRTPRRPPGGW
jgi:hypothetical protein